LIDEYDYWEGVFDGSHEDNRKEIKLQADSEVVESHLSILDELSRSFPIQEIAILDVGAGPLTCINKLYKGVRLNITAVDALAEYYDNLLQKYGIDPPIRTQLCKGEEIAQRFSKESFHWINARNTLDHMESPVECIKGMLPLLKQEGVISLLHYPSVASKANFAGFHQYDLFLEGDDFCIAGKNKKDYVNITKMLLPNYSTSTSLSQTPGMKKVMLNVIVKHAQ